MREIYNSGKMKITIDDENKLILTEWIIDSDFLEDNTIKDEIEKSSQILEQYKPDYILSDDSSRMFPYTVEVQDFVAKRIYMACVKAGIKKFAVVLPKDIIANISTEQLAEENQVREYEIKFFEDREQAFNWLKL